MSYIKLTVVLILLIGINTLGLKAKETKEQTIQSSSNSEINSIKPDYSGLKYIKDRFISEYDSKVGKELWPIIKWKLSPNPKAKQKKAEKFSLPVIKHKTLPTITSDYIMWLGHASFLIKIANSYILLDPALTAPPFMLRKTALPLSISELKGIDYLLVSHGHYDHLDSVTIKKLSGQKIKALVPLKMGALIKKWNSRIKIKEAKWFQKYQIPDKELEIFLLPAKHWHKRGLTDLNKILWGSYLIRYKDTTIYFAGDTGYADHFKKISELFPDIDYALMPIGAYDPSYLMRDNHINPQEAMKAFKDLKAKVFIPMHYGTFDLSDEPMGEPIKWLQKLAAEEAVEDQVKILKIGEILKI